MRLPKTKKTKEPVKIRFRKLKHGGLSLYLDIYYNRKRSYKNLELYLVPENNEFDVEQNKAVMKAAMKMKSEIIIQLINGKYKIEEDNQNNDIKLSEWIQMVYDEAKESGKSITKQMKSTLELVKAFAPKTMLSDIDETFCREIVKYIQHTYKTKNGENLKPTSARNYEVSLSIAFNIAVKKGYMEENPFYKLSTEERVQVPESTRVYLTEEEFNAMKNADWKNQEAKRIFIFCCYTGLRISDILNLKWENIVFDGYLARIEKIIKKTKKTISIPLCSSAINQLPDHSEKKKDEMVFPYISPNTINYNIKKAAESVGIQKSNLSIHTARHTFATILLSKDTNINTIKELLGHSDIKTTLIYAKVLDKTKQKAVDLLDEI